MNKAVLLLGIVIVGSIVSGYTIGADAAKYNIPAWVKGVAGFWAQGDITDDDFGEGMSFLIEQRILKVPLIQDLEKEIKKLTSENNNLKDDVQYLEKKTGELEAENKKLRSQIGSSYGG